MAYFKTQEAYLSESNEVCIKTFENVDNRCFSFRLGRFEESLRKAIAKKFIKTYTGVEVVSFYERGYSLDETTFARLPEPCSNEVIYLMPYTTHAVRWTRPHEERFGCDVHLKEYCVR